MSDLELSKNKVIAQLRHLCAHCSAGRDHPATPLASDVACPVQLIAQEIKKIRGVPLIVNNEFRGLLWK